MDGWMDGLQGTLKWAYERTFTHLRGMCLILKSCAIHGEISPIHTPWSSYGDLIM